LNEAAGRVQFGCQRNFLNPIVSKLDKHVVLLLINYSHGGDYTVSRRYEFHVRVNFIKLISSSRPLMLFLLYKRADDAVFDDFPKISDHFPKISEDFPKLFRRPDERFRTFSEHFRTFSEDIRRLPKATEDVSIIH